MPFTIGLTGGIGSGKTTIAQRFQDLNISVVDADEIVRELITNDKDIIAAITQHFGPRYLLSDGTLNRKALREKIFSSPDDRTFLEQLLHPRVRTALKREKEHFDSPYGILVIPLLIEANMQDLVDRILVIDLAVDEQIQRIMQRDQISHEQAEQALSNQISSSERLKYADDVIENTATEEELRHTVDKLHQRYLEFASA